MFRPAILFAVIFWPILLLPQQDVELEVRQASEKLLNIQRNWGPKMNTSGVTISLTPTQNGQLGDHSYAGYRLYESGLPKNAVFVLNSFPIDLKLRKMLDGITFSDRGEAICAGKPGTCTGDKPNDDIDLKFVAADGEPIRLGLISEDGQYKAFVSIVPFPIQARDGNCFVQAIRLLPGFELALLQGTGFPKDAEIKVDSASEGEKHAWSDKADNEGNVQLALAPGVKGKSRGTVMTTLSSPACKLTIKFDWGKGTYRLH